MVTPYNDQTSDKKSQVKFMFNNIANKYDFLNHFLSLGIDKIWRKRTVKTLKQLFESENRSFDSLKLLDVATGTGDLAIALNNLHPQKITGIDISAEMLKIGRQKVIKLKLDKIINLIEGDSEKIEFEDESFDGITAAFGVRNFENLQLGLTEMCRVLKKNGKIAILEFSKPRNLLISLLYNLYFKGILPIWGKLFSKDKRAYTYLPDSVQAFPDGEALIEQLKTAGFSNTGFIKLSFGIASIYYGEKH
jgi:demethylmenaquinone methyltransferase / 2-methoxy-6-polyprenyl-1,4-benzoquinol methylase